MLPSAVLEALLVPQTLKEVFQDAYLAVLESSREAGGLRSSQSLRMRRCTKDERPWKRCVRRGDSWGRRSSAPV